MKLQEIVDALRAVRDADTNHKGNHMYSKGHLAVLQLAVPAHFTMSQAFACITYQQKLSHVHKAWRGCISLAFKACDTVPGTITRDVEVSGLTYTPCCTAAATSSPTLQISSTTIYKFCNITCYFINCKCRAACSAEASEPAPPSS
jgi:hypothetical protein